MKIKLNNNISTKQYKYIHFFILILGIILIYLSISNFIFTKIFKIYGITTANVVSCYNYTNNIEMNDKQSTRTEIKYYFEKEIKYLKIKKKYGGKYQKNHVINIKEILK